MDWLTDTPFLKKSGFFCCRFEGRRDFMPIRIKDQAKNGFLREYPDIAYSYGDNGSSFAGVLYGQACRRLGYYTGYI